MRTTAREKSGSSHAWRFGRTVTVVVASVIVAWMAGGVQAGAQGGSQGGGHYTDSNESR